MSDPGQRITTVAKLYDRWRPSYPSGLIDWIVATCALGPGAAVADVGCGTGISTRLLAGRRLDVTGIDANEALLEIARAHGGATYCRGEASATGLPDGSQQLVVAAQAFHWFDLHSTLAEWTRITAPGGWHAVFWNDRALDTPFMREYESLLLISSVEYPDVIRKPDVMATLRASPLGKDWTEAAFPSVQTLDREGLRGRACSSSYVVHGVADKPAFERALDALFSRHERDGCVDFRYLTIAACWRPNPEL